MGAGAGTKLDTKLDTGRGAMLDPVGTDAAPKSMPGADSTGAGSRLAGSTLAEGVAAALSPLTLIASGACATGAATVAEITEERRTKKVDLTNIVQRVWRVKNLKKGKSGF